MNKLNVNQISLIRIRKRSHEERFEWKTQVKFLGIVFRQEGFYYMLERYTEQRLKNNGYVIEGEKVFSNPLITFCMSNRSYENVEFKTDIEMATYLNSPLLSTIQWIEVDS